MELHLQEKIAIVAASSKGLGKAAALGLAREGAHVAICARHADALEQTAEEIRTAAGVEVLARALDVTDEAAVTQFVQQTTDRFGAVHILVNNAGGPPSKTFADTSVADWRDGVELNLMSTIFFCKAVLPHMRRQRWGRIINITSLAVKQPIDGLILSNAVRAGVAGFAKTLANEAAADNILVNNVCPGYTHTERVDALLETTAARQGIPREAALQQIESKIPLGRMGRPEELANLIVFLASERASYLTGASIQVDGGLFRGLL